MNYIEELLESVIRQQKITNRLLARLAATTYPASGHELLEEVTRAVDSE